MSRPLQPGDEVICTNQWGPKDPSREVLTVSSITKGCIRCGSRRFSRSTYEELGKISAAGWGSASIEPWDEDVEL